MLIWILIVSNVQIPKYLQYVQPIYNNKLGEVFFRYIGIMWYYSETCNYHYNYVIYSFIVTRSTQYEMYQ